MNTQTAAPPESAPVKIEKTGLWNVLIYMAADNNLQEECVYELNEILHLGAMSDIDVTAQFDSGNAMTLYNFGKLRALPAGYSADLDYVAEVLISGREKLRKIADSAVISNFLETEISESRNFVALSGHGSGAVGDFLPTDDPPNSLSIPALESVLRPVYQRIRRKIQILGMDSCLMSMVEVCYQLQPLVNIIVGAEGFEQNTGWPYHKILSVLKQDPKVSAEELALIIVREYIQFYLPYYAAGVSVDMAALDLSDEKSDMLTAAINNLALLLKKHLSRRQIQDAVVLAHWRAQSYKFEQYVDLWDFCNELRGDLEKGIYNIEELKSVSSVLEEWDTLAEKSSELESIKKSAIEWESLRKDVVDGCRNVMDAINSVVLVSCYNGVAFQHSHGLSIYFPWSKSELDINLRHYRKLAFAKATQWDEFLEAYVKETERDVRDDNNQQLLKKEPLGMAPKGLSDIRVNPEIETRVNPEIETRGKMKFAPEVKNPPQKFYKDNLDKKFNERLSDLRYKRTVQGQQ